MDDLSLIIEPLIQSNNSDRLITIKPAKVYQFKVSLIGITPPIWRRIQISKTCTFWDLHVAIQDAMGWYDCHLHLFEAMDPRLLSEKVHFGIPPDDGDYEIINTLPSWEYKLRDYLCCNKIFNYTYDFGDNWKHQIFFEGEYPKVLSKKNYPKCLDGERACPPEDVGGIIGYEKFLKAIQNPRQKEYESFQIWAGGLFDPEFFDPREIIFDNPKKRLQMLFEAMDV